jgi:ElaB/YqjD/DUF883 family membrane-anchored ribosome-binding protein
MGDNRTDLPEGTDTIIDSDEMSAGPQGSGGNMAGGTATPDTSLVANTTSAGGADRPLTGSGTSDTGLRQRLRDGGDKLSGQVGDRARGFLTQGLERSAEALSNVSRLVGDTAEGIDERLGPEYGEYARRAAAAIEDTANSIASKDPDELIEDTRNFVRNSPGVAVAGAAIIGFAVARLLKAGLSSNRDEDDED